ncbi:hypothetical protein V2J09_004774 [Rumex salicifolius]
MQKLVVKLSCLCNKQKPMKAVSSLQGVVSIEMDDNKIIIVGDMDPILAVKKLRRWGPSIESVGPAKEEKKAEEEKKTEEKTVYTCFPPPPYAYNAHPYYVHVYEENPNSCVIS